MLLLAQGFIIGVLLLLYIHIRFQLKVSHFPEVYSLDGPEATKERLDTLCNSRQPVFVQRLFLPDLMLQMVDTVLPLTGYQQSNIQWPVRHHLKPQLLATSVSTAELRQLLVRPTPFYTEGMGSNSVLASCKAAACTIVAAWSRWLDPLLSPSLVVRETKDLWCGSANTRTPIRYEVAFRTYLIGAAAVPVRVQLFLPNTYLWSEDYTTNFEFRTLPKPSADQLPMAATKELTLNLGDVVYIPAKWWYSVEFLSGDSRVIVCQYYTYMNALCLLPTMARFGLQLANTLVGSQPMAALRPISPLLNMPQPVHNVIRSAPLLPQPLPPQLPQQQLLPPHSLIPPSDVPSLEPAINQTDTKPLEPATNQTDTKPLESDTKPLESIEMVVAEQDTTTNNLTKELTQELTQEPTTPQKNDI
jgi:hypothetical protein